MSNSRDLSRVVTFVLAMLVATALQAAGPPDVAGKQTPAADESPPHLAALEQRIVAAAEKAKRSVVRIAWFNNRVKAEGSCSGVILTVDGYVVTGAFAFLEHGGVSSGEAVSIHLADGRCAPGVAVGSYREWGCGLIKITQDGELPSAEVDSSGRVKPGEVCLALGYPPAVRAGQFPYDRQPSLRIGRATTTGLMRWLGTSCRIDRSGDRGGGLFDLDGRLIGIHARYHSQEQMAKHRPIEIIKRHWKELAGREPAEGRVRGRLQETGQSLGKVQPPPVPAPDDPRLVPAVAKASQATVAIEGPDLDISGVLVSPDGYIVTCAHHRKPRGTAATIHLADGRSAPGELLGRHPLLDVGLAKITAPGPWPHTQMGSAAAVKPGDLCLALGYPSFDDDGLRRPRWHEVVVRVSRIRDTSMVEEELRSTFESWGGDSGGGLFDSQGRLIGVHKGGGPDGIARQASIDLVKKHWDLLVKGTPAEDPAPFDHSPTAEAFRNAVRHVPPLTVEVLSDEKRHQKRRALGTIVSSAGHILTKASELRFPLLSPTHDGLGTSSLRSSGFPAVFDTDAIITKDSCGGPVVDRLGEVVGISIAVPTEGRVYVVPAAVARRIAEGKTSATSPQSGTGES